MLEFILKLLGLSAPTTPVVPAPVTELKRVNSNVKVVWTKSVTSNVTKQHIVVTRNGVKVIEKDLNAWTDTFSFAALKNAKCKVEIVAIVGSTITSDVASIEFDI